MNSRGRGVAAAMLLSLAGCGSPPPRQPLPALSAPLPPPVALIPRQAPAVVPQASLPDPETGRPPGWYLPEPPPVPESFAMPAQQPETTTGVTAPLPPAESAPRATTPEARTRALLRDFPWISGFWSELAPAERARAERAFARRGERVALAERWDGMGLGERVVLLFGAGRG